MAHIQAPNCMIYPLPGNDLDPIGPLLRDLDRTVTDLQLVVPARLLGDAAMLDAAILGLTLVRRRIDELNAAREAAE